MKNQLQIIMGGSSSLVWMATCICLLGMEEKLGTLLENLGMLRTSKLEDRFTCLLCACQHISSVHDETEFGHRHGLGTEILKPV